ncbi:zinc-binding dehydrogenase [Salinispira pacifica]
MAHHVEDPHHLRVAADDALEAVAAVELGPQSVDVIIDVVGGSAFPALFDLLRRGGRYATSGAVGGPVVTLDLRTLYLRDITLYGATAWAEPVFPNLISYIEKNEIQPVIAGIYPLEKIVEAQKEFQKRRHVGKLVLIPPGL